MGRGFKCACVRNAPHREGEEMKYLIDDRASGRSTRMLKEAIAEAKLKKTQSPIFVIGHSQQHCRILEDMAAQIDPEVAHDKKLIRFMSSEDPNFDFDSFRVLGSNSPVFVDHFAIASRYGHIIEEYFRWNTNDIGA